MTTKNPQHSSPNSAGRPLASGLSRREFLAAAGVTAAAAALGSFPWSESTQAATWRVPRDDAPHIRTWMAWPWDRSIWGSLLPGVQQDVARIARTVAAYEPVVMCAPSESDADAARSMCGSAVEVLPAAGAAPVLRNNDCWMRDIAPVFRIDGSGGRDAIGLGFNGWGGKQAHDRDRRLARRIASHSDVRYHRTRFVGEGGAIETDGDGTVMATESSLVAENRNPRLSRAAVEARVLAAYGAQKMIWVPGIAGRDITDDHIDATSRFIRPGVVMVQVPPASRRDVWARDARRQFEILSDATDARGRRLDVIPMAGPDRVRSNSPDFVDSYVNFHVVNGAVITARFGDTQKDAACRATLSDAFPGRSVVQIDADSLHEGGGGVHCVTMGEPS